MADLRQRLDVTTGLVCLVLARLTYSDLAAAALIVFGGAFIVPAVWGMWREARRD